LVGWVWEALGCKNFVWVTSPVGAGWGRGGRSRSGVFRSAGTGRLKRDGTRAREKGKDFVFRAKRTSPFKSARWGCQFSRLLVSRGVRISCSNAGYTVFRGSVKGTSYTLHSPVSNSLPPGASPCAITFQLESRSGYPFSPCLCARTNDRLCLGKAKTKSFSLVFSPTPPKRHSSYLR
jgi:hypothetical protein